MKPLLIACDFDGTITQRDTLHVIVDEFGVPGLWERLEPRLRSGEITVEQAMQEEFDAVRTTPSDVADLIQRRAPVRAGLEELVDWSGREGHRFVVMSNGFRSVIEPVMQRAGLGRLEVLAHDATFTPHGTTLQWTDRGARCEVCDRPCKREPLRTLRRDERIVLIGDGISDRCASGMADVVFARDFLAEHLDAERAPYHPFDDFHDVLTELRRWAVAA